MKRKLPAIILIGVFLAFGAVYLISVFSGEGNKGTKRYQPYEPDEPKFKKEGELWVIQSSSSDTLGRFDMEVADNEYEITQGLMYRKSMKSDRGMLFKFPDNRMRSFWMKNTHIPLDIIFISENGRIVNIQRDTKPFSEQSVPSTGPAKYVLEVNAGTASSQGWTEGDLVVWADQ